MSIQPLERHNIEVAETQAVDRGFEIMGDVPYALDERRQAVVMGYDHFVQSIVGELKTLYRQEVDINRNFDMTAVQRIHTYFFRDFPDCGLPMRIIFLADRAPTVPWFGGVRMIQRNQGQINGMSGFRQESPQILFQTVDGAPLQPHQSAENRDWWRRYMTTH